MAVDEASARIGDFHLGVVYVYLNKFYDRIPFHALIRRALALEFPAIELYMCLLMYLSPRIVRTAGAHSRAIHPTIWVLAGCGCTNHFARILLYAMLEQTCATAPMACVRELFSTTTPSEWKAQSSRYAINSA